MNSRPGVTATTDMAVLLSELEALRAGGLASSGVGPYDVPFRYGSASILDFGFLTTIDDIRGNSSDFTICSQSLTNFYAIFNPQSARSFPKNILVTCRPRGSYSTTRMIRGIYWQDSCLVSAISSCRPSQS